MKKFRKTLTVLACMTAAMFALTGCSTNMSYTYKVGTGDEVKVTLDTSEGLVLENEDSGFSVTKDDDTILQGIFVDEDTYEVYRDSVKADDTAEIVEEDSANGITWIYYHFDGASGMESDFIAFIDGSSTGVIIASLEDADTAEAAFDSLSFSVE